MGEEVNLEVIKNTQSSLGKHVKKPPLTEKLLKKPPFRFLHDIVTSVLKTTGFFDGLFDEEDLISENVKDRDSKITFLNKVITILVATTGKSISVKPSKVVAGQEPEKTNELLQLLAEALDKNLSSNEAVQKFKEKSTKSNEQSEKPKETKLVEKTKKTNNEKKLTAQSSEKLTSRKKEASKNEKIKSTTNLRTKDESKDTKRRNDIQSTKAVSQAKTTKKPEKTIQRKNSIQREKSLQSSNSSVSVAAVSEAAHKTKTNGDVNDDHNESEEDDEMKVQVQLNSSYTILPQAENDFNGSGSAQEHETNGVVQINNKETIENQKVEVSNEVKDDNAIKIPPNPETVLEKPKENVNERLEEKVPTRELKKSNSADTPGTKIVNENNLSRPQSMRPSSSRPGAPRVRDKHENILTAADSNILVGKVNIIVENTPNEEEEETSIIIIDQKLEEEVAENMPLTSNPRGHLVQQILESQKEYSQSGKTEIEWQFGAHRAREALNQEMEQVRFNIQALSRVANPLGKLLDHIQEDVEVMRQELQQWKQSYEEASQLLAKQNMAKDDSLQPLRSKIKQLHADINDKHEKINDLKVVVHKNASRIDKLLPSGNVQ